MTLSLNEVEAVAKKATRGAGYSWGLAEEAGRAVRWLCAMDIEGCAALADLLTEVDADVLAERELVLGNTWTSSGDRLCPLFAGAALSDLAETLNGQELLLEHVARPILLAPFAALSARCLQASVLLEWKNTCIATNGEHISVSGDTDTASATVTARVKHSFEEENPRTPKTRADPDPHTLAVLDRFAHRTYAPATEASRLSGAGAGLSDND